MDYRQLLQKYIAHVTEIQGVDFLTMGRTKSSIVFTADERAALDAVSEDAELASVLGEPPASDGLILDNPASANLTALFMLIGSYIRTAGPVNLEFRDGDKVVTTAQDALMRHLADRILVISDAVLTDEVIRALPHRGRHAMIDDDAARQEAVECRAALVSLAKGE